MVELRKGQGDVKLTREEFELPIEWLDTRDRIQQSESDPRPK